MNIFDVCIVSGDNLCLKFYQYKFVNVALLKIVVFCTLHTSLNLINLINKICIYQISNIVFLYV